ncbi:MAG: hypothetical protein U0271_38635 [Polyangiaceae bacterium]
MVVLDAMKKAAEIRLTSLVEYKRNRHYGHAAELVATCVACANNLGSRALAQQGNSLASLRSPNKSDVTARWAAALQAKYRRFHALRGLLERAARAR